MILRSCSRSLSLAWLAVAWRKHIPCQFAYRTTATTPSAAASQPSFSSSTYSGRPRRISHHKAVTAEFQTVSSGGSRPRTAAAHRARRRGPGNAASGQARASAGQLSLEERGEMGKKRDDKKRQRPLQAGIKAAVGAQPQKKRKTKCATPEQAVRVAVQYAARDQNPAAGLAVYDRAVAEGTRITPDTYTVLLYLCSGGTDWYKRLQSIFSSRGSGLPLNARTYAEQPPAESDQPPAPVLPDQPAASTHLGPPAAADGTASMSGREGAAEENALKGEASRAAVAAAPAAAVAGGRGQQEPRQLWQDYYEPAEGSVEQPSPEVLLARGREIFEAFGAAVPRRPEMAYTALARIAAANGNADEAFEIARKMTETGADYKLRSFTPALIAYCAAGQWEKAFEVDAAVTAAGIDLTENEYGLLVAACAAGAPWVAVRGVLQRMGRELGELSHDTVDYVRHYFKSATASAEFGPDGALATTAALTGASAWALRNFNVRAHEGVCPVNGKPLKAVDLEAEEWEEFSSAVAALAEQREKRANALKEFQEWLERFGPFECVVDGANVALFGQNFNEGAFSFRQIDMVVRELRAKHPGSRVLVVMHVARAHAPVAKSPFARKLLADLRSNNCFYATPRGSNDDWYWLLAAVKAGAHGYLVSNDEMRDHIFQLLAPKYFIKWKQRHQLKYKAWPTNVTLEYPPPYTTCVQELDDGSWLFPSPRNRWCGAFPLPAATVDAAAQRAQLTDCLGGAEEAAEEAAEAAEGLAKSEDAVAEALFESGDAAAEALFKPDETVNEELAVNATEEAVDEEQAAGATEAAAAAAVLDVGKGDNAAGDEG